MVSEEAAFRIKLYSKYNKDKMEMLDLLQLSRCSETIKKDLICTYDKLLFELSKDSIIINYYYYQLIGDYIHDLNKLKYYVESSGISNASIPVYSNKDINIYETSKNNIETRYIITLNITLGSKKKNELIFNKFILYASRTHGEEIKINKASLITSDNLCYNNIRDYGLFEIDYIPAINYKDGVVSKMVNDETYRSYINICKKHLNLFLA